MDIQADQFYRIYLDNIFDKKFIEQRRIFLWGDVNDHSAKDIVNKLLFLDAEKPGEDIQFFINSPGGMITSGMCILDTINMISSPVATICMGLAASMGAILLSSGEKGKRMVWPNARVMIHQPLIGGYFQEDATDMEITANEILKSKRITAQILADNCGHPFEKVMKDIDRNYWMGAEESKEYGIVDDIMTKF